MLECCNRPRHFCLRDENLGGSHVALSPSEFIRVDIIIIKQPLLMLSLLACATALHAPSLLRNTHTASSARSSLIVSSEKITKGYVHGEGGAYVGGYWVPIGEASSKFNIAGGSDEKVPDTVCPRSMTRNSAAKPDGTYESRLFAGCIGARCARELSKTTASVVMIERRTTSPGRDQGQLGHRHAGFDDTPARSRQALLEGQQMFPQLDVRHTSTHAKAHKSTLARARSC